MACNRVWQTVVTWQVVVWFVMLQPAACGGWQSHIGDPDTARKTILVTPNNSMDATEQLQPLTQHSRNETAPCTRWCHSHFVDRAQQLLQPGAYCR
jgi:hypothetical protein